MGRAERHIQVSSKHEKGDDILKYTIILFAATAVVAALLLGKKGAELPCLLRKDKPSSKQVNLFKGMSMELEPDSLCKTGADVVICNTTPLDIESGNETDFKLQIKHCGKWYSLWRKTPLPDEQEHAYGYVQDNPVKLHLDWSAAYGELQQGRYRIVKRFYEYCGEGAKAYFFLAAEFDIRQ